MIFIQSGKADTDHTCQQHEPEASYAVYVQRKGDSNCQQEIFRHMSCFSDIIVNALCFVSKFVIAFSKIQHFIPGLRNLIADLIAYIPGHLPGLGRERKNQVHHQNCRKKG